MLHVLLTILKIIGIILLVILGIILFLILLVLFVPVRYRVHVRIDQDVFEADGRVSWLFHLLRVDLDYAKRSGQAVIRLLGKKIKTIRFPQEQPEPEPVPGAEEEQEKGSDAADSVRSEAAAQIETTGTKDSAGAKDGSGGDHEKGSGAKGASGTDQETGSGSRDAAGTDQDKITDSKASGGADQEEGAGAKASAGGDQEEGAEADNKDIGEKITRIIEKLLSLFEKLLDLVMRLLYLPYDIYDQYESVTHRTGAKIDAIKKKVAPFLSIEGEHIIRKLIRYLKKLILHYAPRKISGYLRFGTSLPDLTGQLTGLVYVLLPKAGSGYSVEPDFYEMRLETDTTASGHIRMNHLVWVAIRLVIDKEFWALFRKIRGRDKTGKSGGRGHSHTSGTGTGGWDDDLFEEESGNGSERDSNGSHTGDKRSGAEAENTAAENSSSENGYDRYGPENGHKGNHHKRAGKKHKKKRTGNRKISKKR